MQAGLDMAIVDPASEEVMAAICAYNVLTGRDAQSAGYIARYADRIPTPAELTRALQNAQALGSPEEGPYDLLMKAVEQGLKGEAAAATRALLQKQPPLTLVDNALIPALDAVGGKYETGALFLPQLLQAASAAQSAFDEIKAALARTGGAGAAKGRIVLATVRGDVHDLSLIHI